MKKHRGRVRSSFWCLNFTQSLLIFSGLIFFSGSIILGSLQLYSYAHQSAAALEKTASLAAALNLDASFSSQIVNDKQESSDSITLDNTADINSLLETSDDTNFSTLSLDSPQQTPLAKSHQPLSLTPHRSPTRAIPTITSIVPNSGPLSGGQTITITGSHFKSESATWQQIATGENHTCALDM